MVMDDTAMKLTSEKIQSIIDDMICATINDTFRSMADICNNHGLTDRAFYLSIERNPDYFQSYARARVIQAIIDGDKIPQWEQKGLDDVKSCEPKRANAVATIYTNIIKRIMWKLERLDAKHYGAKIDVSGDNKLTVTITDNSNKDIKI